MSSILEEFAYGNLSTAAPSYVRDSRYTEVMELVVRIKEKLLDALGAHDKDLFEKYVDAQGEAHQLTAVRNLVYGYKLGLTMTAEAFVGLNEL